MKVAQSHLILCNPMDYTVHGILQARILEWVASPFSKGSSQPRDRTEVSLIVGRFFTSRATREAFSNERKKVKLLSHVQLFVTPRIVTYQASLSMEFSRLEYQSRLPFPSPGDLPDPGIRPRSSALQVVYLPSEPLGKTRGVIGPTQTTCIQNGEEIVPKQIVGKINPS